MKKEYDNQLKKVSRDEGYSKVLSKYYQLCTAGSLDIIKKTYHSIQFFPESPKNRNPVKNIPYGSLRNTGK